MTGVHWGDGGHLRPQKVQTQPWLWGIKILGEAEVRFKFILEWSYALLTSMRYRTTALVRSEQDRMCSTMSGTPLFDQICTQPWKESILYKQSILQVWWKSPSIAPHRHTLCRTTCYSNLSSPLNFGCWDSEVIVSNIVLVKDENLFMRHIFERVCPQGESITSYSLGNVVISVEKT